MLQSTLDSSTIKVMVALAGLMLSQNALGIASNFNNDHEGWTVVGGALAYEAGGGNPGGYITATDEVSGIMMALAPEAFLGDLTAFDGGLLSVDLIDLQTAGSDPVAQFGEVAIEGTSGTVVLDLVAGGAPTDWLTFAVGFDATTWGVSEETWLAILGDVTSIKIAVDLFQFFGDSAGIDNFRVVIPVPAGVWLFASALLGLLTASRRRCS